MEADVLRKRLNDYGKEREITIQITDKGGHYLLSLKENQQELYDDAVCGFKACKS